MNHGYGAPEMHALACCQMAIVNHDRSQRISYVYCGQVQSNHKVNTINTRTPMRSDRQGSADNPFSMHFV